MNYWLEMSKKKSVSGESKKTNNARSYIYVNQKGWKITKPKKPL